MPLAQESIDTLHALLENNFSFYENLDDRGKLKFMKRLLQFIGGKKFSGREGLEVQPAMKVLVSASAVQLTFGLQDFLFPHFREIILYPAEYYSPGGGAWHKGDTDMQGRVSFSWNDFQAGYEDPDDRINLGLHEWSHAMMAEVRISEEGNTVFEEYFQRWRMAAKPVMEGIKEEGYSDIFRPYGATSPEEFFAVSVEVFFEQPLQFRERAPELYQYMCLLLNQYPHAKEAHEELLSIAEAGEPLLLIKPGRGTILSFLIAGLAIAIISIPLTLNIFTGLVILILTLIIGVYLFFRELRTRNSLRLYQHFLEVFSFAGHMRARFMFNDLASVEILEESTSYKVCFNLVEQGRVLSGSYHFQIEEGELLRFSEFLAARQVPLLRQAPGDDSKKEKGRRSGDDLWQVG